VSSHLGLNTFALSSRCPILLLVSVCVGGCAMERLPPPEVEVELLSPHTPACGDDGARMFDDVTLSSGLHHLHTFYPENRSFHARSTGGGVVLEDLDGDGDLDAVLTNSGGDNALFTNEGDGRFVLYENSLDIAYPEDLTMGISAADYDNDGDTDLLLLNRGPDRLLANDGAARFTDVTAAAGIVSPGASASGTWGDLDQDGDLDLFIAVLAEQYSVAPEGMVYDRPLLYRNLGEGRFEDMSDEVQAGGLPAGSSFLAALVDLDHDRDLDILLTQEFGSVHLTNILYENLGVDDQGRARFRDASEGAGVAVPRAAMGIALTDVDTDGRIDLFITNLFGAKPSREVLLRNLGGLSFEDVTEARGAFAMTLDTSLEHPRHVSWGTSALDLENDGDDDLYIAYGHFEPTEDYPMSPGAYSPLRAGQQNATLRNDGSGDYAPFTDPCLDDPGQSRGVAAGDIDDDGCIDIIVVNQDEPVRVYRNRCISAGAHLSLSLVGTQSNRDAVGARVTVVTQDRAQVKLVHGCATSVHSCEPKRLHFGLGDAEAATVSIEWPGGATQTLNLTAGAHRLVEP
jgi:hypothetical protein